jgi:SAM-dependent methyltransferase
MKPWLYDMLQWYVHKGHSKQKDLLHAEISRLANNLGRDRNSLRVLELACGTGNFTDCFSPNQYLGIDSDSLRLTKARKLFPHHRFEDCKIDSDNAAGILSGIDFVFCHGFLHHISDADFLAIIRCFREHTSDKAVFLAIEPLLPESPWTSPFAYTLAKADDGKFMRTEKEYKTLFGPNLKKTSEISFRPRWPVSERAFVLAKIN